MIIKVDELDRRNYSIDLSAAGSVSAGSIPANKLGYITKTVK